MKRARASNTPSPVQPAQGNNGGRGRSGSSDRSPRLESFGSLTASVSPLDSSIPLADARLAQANRSGEGGLGGRGRSESMRQDNFGSMTSGGDSKLRGAGSEYKQRPESY